MTTAFFQCDIPHKVQSISLSSSWTCMDTISIRHALTVLEFSSWSRTTQSLGNSSSGHQNLVTYYVRQTQSFRHWCNASPLVAVHTIKKTFRHKVNNQMTITSSRTRLFLTGKTDISSSVLAQLPLQAHLVLKLPWTRLKLKPNREDHQYSVPYKRPYFLSGAFGHTYMAVVSIKLREHRAYHG